MKGKLTLTVDARKVWHLSDLVLGSDHAHEQITDDEFFQRVIDRIVLNNKQQKSDVTPEQYFGTIIEDGTLEENEWYVLPRCREDIEGKIVTIDCVHCNGTGLVAPIESEKNAPCDKCNGQGKKSFTS